MYITNGIASTKVFQDDYFPVNLKKYISLPVLLFLHLLTYHTWFLAPAISYILIVISLGPWNSDIVMFSYNQWFCHRDIFSPAYPKIL